MIVAFPGHTHSLLKCEKALLALQYMDRYFNNYDNIFMLFKIYIILNLNQLLKTVFSSKMHTAEQIIYTFVNQAIYVVLVDCLI